MTDDLIAPPNPGPGQVTALPDGEPTLGALVHDLSQQIPELIRSELRLAQAEVTEKGKRAGLGIGMFGAAGLLAFFGVGDAGRDRGARPWPWPSTPGSRP